MEKDIHDLKARDKILGETLAWIVDALLLDDSDPQNADRIKRQKQEALESLSYVRDVLMTNASNLDNDRLIGGEEKTRRKLKAQKEVKERQAATALAVVAPPAPVPVVDSQVKHPMGAQRGRPRSPDAVASPKNGSADFSQRAPWNYTRSSFAAPTSAIPSALMPRPPPPTSTSMRREATKSRDQTPAKTEGYQDPLGALR